MATDESSPWADGEVLRLRSIYVSPTRGDAESRGGSPAGRDERKNPNDGPVEGIGESNNDDTNTKGFGLDPIKLPRSTHTLLFTQPVCSLPFAFSVGILAMSFVCLGLAFADNNALFSNGPPSNVTLTVRGAQYLAVLVVLLMEEEIPTGLHLLRMIPRQSFRQKFPRTRYRRFVLSSVVRILSGYYFLFNAMLVLVQATDVLDIFYDMLALQFVQQLDDIAFFLAKTDVLGKSLQRACTAECFRAEFDRRRRGKSRRLNVFLKSIYLINLCGMMGGMVYVTITQMRGDYQPRSIDVDFGNTVWDGAFVRTPSWLPSPPDDHEGWTLVYAYFNGVYEMDDIVGGRPRYREMRKFDRARYQKVAPAEFKYCQDINAWVFTHESISRTKSAEKSKHGCDWLLRSPETDEFNLLNVVGDWHVWVGAIGEAEVSISTNRCRGISDCNLNGECVDGECICYSDAESGVQYLGTHCEVSLKDECHTIVGEFYNETYSVSSLNTLIKYFTGSSNSFGEQGEELFQMYSRPVYGYIEGNPEVDSQLLDIKLWLNFTGDISLSYLYAGNRWFFNVGLLELDNKDEALEYIVEYHGFWNLAHTTLAVSDPANSNSGTPVGVDLYEVVKEGEQFGPFGALKPLQNNTGWGYFRCGGPGSNSGNDSTADRRLRLRQNFLGRKRYGNPGP